MKNIKEVDSRVIDFILDDLNTSLSRLGINTTLHYYEGHIMSDSFQTMPVIFKELNLEGSMTVTDENEKYVDICVRLDYRWKHFDGGHNGCSLGCVYYRQNGDIIDDMDMGYFVRKVKSLLI